DGTDIREEICAEEVAGATRGRRIAGGSAEVVAVEQADEVSFDAYHEHVPLVLRTDVRIPHSTLVADLPARRRRIDEIAVDSLPLPAEAGADVEPRPLLRPPPAPHPPLSA